MGLPALKYLLQGACDCRHGVGEGNLKVLCLIGGRLHDYGTSQGSLFPKAVKASIGLTKWDLANDPGFWDR